MHRAVRSEGFHVDCGFEKTDGKVDIEDYAAFIYGISMVGEPPENGVLRVLWRSDRLTLMEHNNFTAPECGKSNGRIRQIYLYSPGDGLLWTAPLHAGAGDRR